MNKFRHTVSEELCSQSVTDEYMDTITLSLRRKTVGDEQSFCKK